jgi:uncharacterized membrane protein YgcG
MNCLSESELSSYLDEELSPENRKKIEAHISGCGKCLDVLVVAYEAGRIRKKKQAGRKNRTALKWLAGFFILFAASFVFKKFFLQFLIAAAVFGFKWAMEGEGARKTIMVFRGLEKKDKKFERKSYPPVSNITGGDNYGEE